MKYGVATLFRTAVAFLSGAALLLTTVSSANASTASQSNVVSRSVNAVSNADDAVTSRVIATPSRTTSPQESASANSHSLSLRSSSPSLEYSRTLSATTTTLSLSPASPQQVGTTLVLSALVTGSGSPTGTVNFEDQGTTITGCGAVTISSGAASCNDVPTTAGTHSFSALYSGDVANASSTSSSVSFAVTAAPGAPRNVSVSTITNGTATVSWTASLITGNYPVLGYTVTSTYGSNLTGPTCTIAASAITGSSDTSCTVPNIPVGVTITFSVTATSAGGTGAPATITVISATSLPTSSVLLSATPAAPQNVGTPITFSAQVPSGATGTINFELVTASTTASIPGCAARVINAGYANCTSSSLVAGTSGNNVIAVYSGDTNTAGSTSATLNYVVSSTILTQPSSPLTITSVYGLASTPYTLTTSGGSGTGAITYTVTNGTATGCAVSGASLTATIAGTCLVTATQNADGTYLGQSSPQTTVSLYLEYAATYGIVGYNAVAGTVNGPYTGQVQVCEISYGSGCVAYYSPPRYVSVTLNGPHPGTVYTPVWGYLCPEGGTLSNLNCFISSGASTTTPPSPPTLVYATAQNSSVNVSWTAPPFTGGAVVTSYSVAAVDLTNANNGGQTGTVSGPTSCTISGLTNGDAYTFTVTATSLNGPSTPSVPSNTVVPATSPGVPINVTATAGNASAVVNWSAPSTNGGSAITTYQVAGSPSGTCIATSTTSCTVTGLTNGVTYSFTVTAVNVVGTSVASSASNSVTPLGAPGAPTNASAVAGNAQATVTWSAPASNGGATISSYTVTSSSGRTCTTTSATTCVVTGLTNGTSYTFTVTATNSVGQSLVSSPSNAVTPATVPSTPIAVTAVNGYSWSDEVTALGTGSNQWSVANVGTSNASWNYNGSGASASFQWVGSQIISVIPGSTYTLSASINATSATSAPPYIGIFTPNFSTGYFGLNQTPGVSGIVTGTWTVPAGVTQVVVIEDTDNATVALGSSISWSSPSLTIGNGPNLIPDPTLIRALTTVTWTAPSNNGSAITNYTVTASPGGVTCTSTTTTCSFLSLNLGTSYTFSVTATNSVGTSTASVASNAVVPIAAPASPNAPTTTAGNGLAVITWTAPSANGSPITGYAVTSSGGQACSTTGTTTCTVTGLTNGSSYTFNVTASNAMGTSPQSTPSALLNTAFSDISGNSNSGTAEGTVTLVANGPLSGGAISLPGTTGSDVYTSTPFVNPASFTVSGWFKTSSSGSIMGASNLQTDAQPSSYDRQLWIDSTGHLVFGLYAGGTDEVVSPRVLDDGTWHFVVASYGAAGQQLYVDGSLVASNTSVTSGQPYTYYWHLGYDFTAGWPDNPGGYNFNGSLAQVALFNAQLTAAQITNLYGAANATVEQSAILALSPSAYWPLAGSASALLNTALADISGNSNSGTAEGAVTLVASGPLSGGAISLPGTAGSDVYTSIPFANPASFTVSGWFKTSSSGSIMGASNLQTDAQPSNYDRQLWIDSTGHLVFALNNGSLNEVVSPRVLDDGTWHFVVASYGAAGLQLYVDGSLVASNTSVTSAQPYTFYWHLGYAYTAFWPDSNANYNLNGSLAQVALFNTQLNATQVTNLYSATSTAAEQSAILALLPRAYWLL